MSYWYARFSKKHVGVLLLAIPVFFVVQSGLTCSTYAIGSIATASRTLFDWIAQDANFETFELQPNVHMQMEYGCIEWLGFSTCETVQFKEWMTLWTRPEHLEITVYNTTQTTDGPTSAALPSVHVGRGFIDAGTQSWAGDLFLIRGFGQGPVNPDALAASVHIPNLRAVASQNNKITAQTKQNLLHKTTVGTLLGAIPASDPSDVVFFQSVAQGGHFHQMNVPAKGTALGTPGTYFKDNAPGIPMQRDGVKNLMYFTTINTNMERCAADPNCGAGCTWSANCEPLPYGHHGILLPAGTFFFENKAWAGWGHWPDIPWKYQIYCPKGAEKDGEDYGSLYGCTREKTPPTINVFNPEISVSTLYENKEVVELEKYNNIKAWKWQKKDLLGLCGGIYSLNPGKDCGQPYADGYVSVDFLSHIIPNVGAKILYVSSGPSTSEISSEFITGLQMDYLDSWQMNARIETVNAGAEWYPLFWVVRRPAADSLNKKTAEKFNADFQGHGGEMQVYVLVGFLCYIVFFGVWLFLVLYGFTCVEYLNQVSKRWEPHAPNYI